MVGEIVLKSDDANPEGPLECEAALSGGITR